MPESVRPGNPSASLRATVRPIAPSPAIAMRLEDILLLLPVMPVGRARTTFRGRLHRGRVSLNVRYFLPDHSGRGSLDGERIRDPARAEHVGYPDCGADYAGNDLPALFRLDRQVLGNRLVHRERNHRRDP